MKEYTNSEILSAIEDRIHSERNRAILKRRLIDGLTYERLAEEFDLSENRTKVLAYKGIEKVYHYMKKNNMFEEDDEEIIEDKIPLEQEN